MCVCVYECAGVCVWVRVWVCVCMYVCTRVRVCVRLICDIQFELQNEKGGLSFDRLFDLLDRLDPLHVGLQLQNRKSQNFCNSIFFRIETFLFVASKFRKCQSKRKKMKTVLTMKLFFVLGNSFDDVKKGTELDFKKFAVAR